MFTVNQMPCIDASDILNDASVASAEPCSAALSSNDSKAREQIRAGAAHSSRKRIVTIPVVTEISQSVQLNQWRI